MALIDKLYNEKINVRFKSVHPKSIFEKGAEVALEVRMSLRKHWGKFTLSIAAGFWAGCNDTGTEPETKGEAITCGEQGECGVGNAIALYGVPTYDISSGSVVGECEPGAVCGESSSSEAVESSSSVESEYPYVLYSDPNVRCKDSTKTELVTCNYEPLIASADDEYAPLYGVTTPACIPHEFNTPYFKCDNGEVLDGYSCKEKDGIVYTNEEYGQLFDSGNSADQ